MPKFDVSGINGDKWWKLLHTKFLTNFLLLNLHIYIFSDAHFLYTSDFFWKYKVPWRWHNWSDRWLIIHSSSSIFHSTFVYKYAIEQLGSFSVHLKLSMRAFRYGNDRLEYRTCNVMPFIYIETSKKGVKVSLFCHISHKIAWRKITQH